MVMSKKLIKQKENVENLFKLIQENPNLEILPMVATDCVCDVSFGYWTAEWGNAKVTKYWINDDRIHEYDELEDLVDEWVDNNYEDYKDLSDDELFNLAEERIKSQDWKPAIIVYIKSF